MAWWRCGEISMNLPCSSTPALLTSTSIEVSFSLSANLAGAPERDKSQDSTRTATPYFAVRVSPTAPSLSALRATSTRSKFSAAKRWASASPMPDDAPVTSAVDRAARIDLVETAFVGMVLTL